MGNGVGRTTLGGSITEFPLTFFPGQIIAAPDGNLWVYGGRISTSGVFTQFASYTCPSLFCDGGQIAVGPDGNLWFDTPGEAPAGSFVGRWAPSGNFLGFITIDNNPGSVGGITAGPDGNVWLANQDGSAWTIDRVTLSGAVARFPLPGTLATPVYDMTAGPDGNVWFTDWDNTIGRVTPSGNITEFPIPTANSQPYGITKGPDGNLWFTESAGNKIGRITP